MLYRDILLKILFLLSDKNKLAFLSTSKYHQSLFQYILFVDEIAIDKIINLKY